MEKTDTLDQYQNVIAALVKYEGIWGFLGPIFQGYIAKGLSGTDLYETVYKDVTGFLGVAARNMGIAVNGQRSTNQTRVAS